MKPDRILVIGLNWIGDAIMSMPALQACRDENPEAHIVLLVKPYLKPLWEMHAVPDEIYGLDKTLPTIAKLRAGKFGKACILPNSFRSAFLPAMAGIPRRIGLRGELRTLMLSQTIPLSSGHQSNEYYPILAPLHADKPHAPPRLDIPETTFQSLEKKLPDCGSYIVLMPGAARGASKKWPIAHFETLAQRLIAETNFSIVFAGGAADAPACEELAGRMGEQAASVAGKTGLQEWAALLQRSSLAIANDSGGMHLAAAVGTPVVGIYGMTDPEKTGPLSDQCIVVKSSYIQNRDIARNSEEACNALESIPPESVYEAALKLLK